MLVACFANQSIPMKYKKIIMSFKSNKLPGPKVLKQICIEICCLLAHICNLSFLTGVVPDSLKLAEVIPVYKKGDKCQPGNYRPISLLSIFDSVRKVYVIFSSFIIFCMNSSSDSGNTILQSWQ